ncbi:DNA double-strand break repair nuclease NurA [Methanobacterium alcaliphilum]|uniref:DNA double-strand break repair nuclease NurA n=1 Tax=Methanobacterium alcaliphilum TaxID=392018 RepID=UPI00200AA000|nr:DNA double-strand break repair nuclease NurA [Methanobacterium alcaliphilum]MCK9151807.1 DNA double-strand break repair nuclease NurA [Methanobacterium alcaliphilum]
MAYKTGIEGFITETLKERFGEMDKIRAVFREMKDDAESLRDNLLIDIANPEYSDLKRNVIAVDGSNYQEQFESISITIATAYAYLNNKQIERYLPNVKIVPPYYSNLVNSIRMRNLEYNVALDVIKEINNQKETVDLILLDGAMTFPDEALGDYIDNVPWVKEVYDEHHEAVNNFFDYVIDNNIPTAAVVKDSMANKYFLSLYSALNNFKNNSEIDYEFLQKNKDFINKWNKEGTYNIVSENSFLRNLFYKKQFCRTKYAEVTCSLRNEIPAKQLRGNVIGFYFKSLPSEKPFFVEVPIHFKDKIDDITQLLSTYSYYSLRPGYPFPLYVAHKKVELKKKYAKNIALILRNIARKDLKEDYNLLFSDKFHDKL